MRKSVVMLLLGLWLCGCDQSGQGSGATGAGTGGLSSVSFVDPAHVNNPSENVPAPEVTPDPVTAARDLIFELTNQQRAANGVAPLTRNADLDAAAQAYAEEMATQNFFSHTAPDGSTPGDRITAAGYTWMTYGENIAEGYTTPGAAMNAWMNSSGHRANILNGAFKDIGIGYAPNSQIWVQDFGAQ